MSDQQPSPRILDVVVLDALVATWNPRVTTS
jgi:hypothetical protein